MIASAMIDNLKVKSRQLLQYVSLRYIEATMMLAHISEVKMKPMGYNNL